ncbi:MAG: 50S ribosomal protein L3 [Tissierellia bacterium]|jgi:large subunit ribosomal protein L3|nr:50S ribosomal protein L3 [Tissierellia bacterium]MDD3226421.1 50S ribosomal protein L3 [Tissierellia bacterium]MDD3750584.1 50S ribosomal protein L3 [Tissierellia bacterium]MDD4046985.1 50S ribosomal protein L3 [Tissierellia bacterium]MDD4679026.1 50S ribosomal protein L3 [Tissierellia bacterium]
MKAILGKKIGMTQVFTEQGEVIPVTVLESGNLVVVQKKTEEKDGYNAIQVGFGDVKIKNVIKPKKGHFDKSKVEPKRFLREFRVDNIDDYEVGQKIGVDIFQVGEKVDVSGISKGKGFQGPIKRHGHSRGGMSHGSKFHRLRGSLGASAGVGKVVKGTKAHGHMGNEKVTVLNLEVVRVDADKNVILLKGAVPGPKKGLVKIREAVRKSK